MTPNEIDEVSARLQKAESDTRTWRLDGDEEKYIEAYDRAEEAEASLEKMIEPAPRGSNGQGDATPPAMLNNLSSLIGLKIVASDGPIGHVKAALFDDESWVIRYLVVDTGTWLDEREVLISPYSIEEPLDPLNGVRVSLSREQIRASPSIDTHLPVSRQHERDYLDYYAFPEYWGGANLWGMGTYPLAPLMRPGDDDVVPGEDTLANDIADVHLRSSTAVTDFEIQAKDGSVGHIEDFVFEARTWAIRYVAVKTGGWWLGGTKVILATRWFDRIDWPSRRAFVALDRQQIKDSPPFDGATIDRNYERRLHEAYAMKDYWSDRPLRDEGNLVGRA